MFEYDEEKKTWAARHHPFTAPKDGHEELFDTDPGKALAKAYDVVLNGWEIGGGSVRIHRPEVQAKVFAALGISARGPAEEIRLPARRAAVRRAAARRHRVRPRPHGHADVRRRVDPRRDRIPQDAARTGPAHRRADAGHRAAAARPAHQGAANGRGQGDRETLQYTGRTMHRARPPPNAAAGSLLAAALFCAPPAFARARPARCPTSPSPTAEGGREVLALIRNGGPFRYDRDGVVFGNCERLLPPERAAIITNTRCARRARRTAARAGSSAAGRTRRPTRAIYTGDHYRSFQRIRE